MFTRVSRQVRTRCFLDDLLMSPLHTTFSFTHVDDVTAAVAEDLKKSVSRCVYSYVVQSYLHLDMTGFVNKFLEENGIIMEESLVHNQRLR